MSSAKVNAFIESQAEIKAARRHLSKANLLYQQALEQTEWPTEFEIEKRTIGHKLLEQASDMLFEADIYLGNRIEIAKQRESRGE